jgi:hypothetical protein
MGLQALTICSQSTYLTNLRKKTLAAIQLGGGGVGVFGENGQKLPYCKGKKEAGIATPI